MDNQTTKNTTKTPKTPATAEIKCVDCGKLRVVGKGETFQVKRCVECQEKHGKALRKTYRKNRIANLRARVEQLEEAIRTGRTAEIEIPA